MTSNTILCVFAKLFVECEVNQCVVDNRYSKPLSILRCRLCKCGRCVKPINTRGVEMLVKVGSNKHPYVFKHVPRACLLYICTSHNTIYNIVVCWICCNCHCILIGIHTLSAVWVMQGQGYTWGQSNMLNTTHNHPHCISKPKEGYIVDGRVCTLEKLQWAPSTKAAVKMQMSCRTGPIALPTDIDEKKNKDDIPPRGLNSTTGEQKGWPESGTRPCCQRAAARRAAGRGRGFNSSRNSSLYGCSSVGLVLWHVSILTVTLLLRGYFQLPVSRFNSRK